MFDLTRLFQAIMAAAAPRPGVQLDVYSSGGVLAARPGAEAADEPTSLAAVLRDAVAPLPRWSGTLTIGDAVWRLSSTPAAGTRFAGGFHRAIMMFVAGLLATAIICALIRFTNRHSRTVELALTDPLTGLANRRAFFQRLNASRHTGFTVLYFDLDHFKDVNDVLGHAAGDELLRQIADRLRALVRPGDLAARFGGDEFAVIEHNAGDAAPIDAMARRINEALARPYEIARAVVRVTASVGIARHAADITDADTLMMQADLALYRAKEDGRNCWRLHSAELAREVAERAAIAEELRGAIERNELTLHYQPQVELATGRIIGLEALLRWHHPTRGLVPPALFVPIAEHNGSILQIGQWAFHEACRQYRAWDDDGIAPTVLSVNFSAVQFKGAVDLESGIDASLKRWRVAPECMEVELAESVLMEVGKVRDGTFEKLRQAGLRVALDNFGTGYSSLSYLATQPVNRLKIAQQMVCGATADPRCAAVVRTAIRLARDLGIELTAEGVETEAEVDFLVAAGCEQAQGFYFSRPVGAARATELLRQGVVGLATSRRPPAVNAA